MKKLIATLAVTAAAFTFSVIPANAAPSSDGVSTVAGYGWRWG